MREIELSTKRYIPPNWPKNMPLPPTLEEAEEIVQEINAEIAREHEQMREKIGGITSEVLKTEISI